ncbi:hypothetical protein [Sedimenticola sp.]|uniref:hypothetical protein n=1 Tax=Sedimenticola sp. TaxID=1940285 RepID=UPI003D0B7888
MSSVAMDAQQLEAVESLLDEYELMICDRLGQIEFWHRKKLRVSERVDRSTHPNKAVAATLILNRLREKICLAERQIAVLEFNAANLRQRSQIL